MEEKEEEDGPRIPLYLVSSVSLGNVHIFGLVVPSG